MRIEDRVTAGLAAVEERLQSVIDSDVPLLAEASAHIVSAGGKRVRPRVTMLAYLAAGGQELDEVVSMAAAIELVHTATLVHDDINDHSLTRRGRDSVHARWGRTFALLTGDYLFATVYAMMAPYGGRLNELMSQACVRLVEGETLQAAAAKSGTMDRETYKKIIARKTASLFEVGARMAAMVAGGDEKTVEALASYGYNLGLTFQIVDDILDIVGDPETLGKPVGADLAQGRGVMAVQNGRVATEEAVAVADDPVAALMAQLRGSGAVDIARVQARETGERARDALGPLPASPARDALEELIDRILARDS